MPRTNILAKIDTFTFNLVFVLFVNIILAFVLHFDLFAKAVGFLKLKGCENFTGHYLQYFWYICEHVRQTIFNGV